MIRGFVIWFIGVLTFLISLVTPRNRNKWCFGGVDNAKYLFLLHDWKRDGIDAYWFTNNRQQAEMFRSAGYNAYTKTSLKGLYHLLTSKMFVITHGLGDVNRWAVGNVKLVNVFHGLPYKKIGLDDPKHKITLLEKLLYPTSIKKYDLLLTTSPFIEAIFRRSFKVKNDKFVESLLPRNQLLVMPKNEVKKFLEKLNDLHSLSIIEKFEKYRNVYMYMPTFRDSNRDFINDAGFDFSRLNDLMKSENSLFVFKLHRATKSKSLKDVNCFSNLMLLDNKLDVYPLLPFTTGLVTDYSSIYFDYILMKEKRIIFYTFDYEQYKSQDRDFNFDESFMIGEYCKTFEDLLALLKEPSLLVEKHDQNENVKLFWNEHSDVSALVEAMKQLSQE